MKRGTPRHRKTRRLAKRLEIPQAHAVGILEMLWHLAGEELPRGDIGTLTNDEIAEAVDWIEEDADRLVAALVDTGWIDAHEEHRLVIHDWPEHCEDAVHNKIARAREHFADGTAPRLTRLSESERTTLRNYYSGTETTETQEDTEQAHAERTPSARQTHGVPTAFALAEPCLSHSHSRSDPKPRQAHAGATVSPNGRRSGDPSRIGSLIGAARPGGSDSPGNGSLNATFADLPDDRQAAKLDLELARPELLRDLCTSLEPESKRGKMSRVWASLIAQLEDANRLDEFRGYMIEIWDSQHGTANAERFENPAAFLNAWARKLIPRPPPGPAKILGPEDGVYDRFSDQDRAFHEREKAMTKGAATNGQ